MRLVTFSALFAALALSACASAPDRPTAGAQAFSQAVAEAMPMGPSVAPPKGYVAMCRDRPQLCIEASVASAVALSSDDQLELLRRVNLRVNSRVRQMTDVRAFGVQGLWTRAGEGDFGAAGDCKAIAVEKRVELEAAGVPARALFYAIAYRSDLGLHAVLVAHTTRGDMVLDSRSPRIVPWGEAPYTWVQRQSQGEAFAWAMVVRSAAPPSPIVLARAD
ncbi:MAG TPA: transglutaminase-like cysteine peptidase [Caulobacteraceae bacterium]